MGNFIVKTGIILGILGGLLVLAVCVRMGQVLLGLWLFLGVLLLLILAVVLLYRRRRDDSDPDALSDSGRIARFVKNPPVKKVYENDAAIWDQMKDKKP